MDASAILYQMFHVMISLIFSQKTEKTEFLSFFYKYCMHVLTAPLLANTAEDSDERGEEIFRANGVGGALVVVL